MGGDLKYYRIVKIFIADFASRRPRRMMQRVQVGLRPFPRFGLFAPAPKSNNFGHFWMQIDPRFSWQKWKPWGPQRCPNLVSAFCGLYFLRYDFLNIWLKLRFIVQREFIMGGVLKDCRTDHIFIAFLASRGPGRKFQQVQVHIRSEKSQKWDFLMEGKSAILTIPEAWGSVVWTFYQVKIVTEHLVQEL